MTHWLKTSFAYPTEENTYVTSTWAPCVPFSFHVPFFIRYSLGSTSFLGRQRGQMERERETDRESYYTHKGYYMREYGTSVLHDSKT